MAEQLAKVGDVIQLGEAIPANVTGFMDADGDPWRRVGADTFTFSAKGDDDPQCSTADLSERPQWFPLTVTAVCTPDPTPSGLCEVGPDGVDCIVADPTHRRIYHGYVAPKVPAERHACWKCGLTVGDIVDRGAGAYADGRLRFMHAYGNCPTADELAELAAVPTAEPQPESDLLDLVRQYGDAREAYAEILRTRSSEEGLDRHATPVNALFARIAAELQRLGENDATGDLQAQRDEAQQARDFLAQQVVKPAAEALDIVGIGRGLILADRILTLANQRDEARGEVERLKAANELLEARLLDAWAHVHALDAVQPGPLVLTLPQVPEGAVALVDRHQRRWTETEKRTPSGQSIWRSESDAVRTYGALLIGSGPLAVEMAAAREPRTWKQWDMPTSAGPTPEYVTVQGWGTYGQREDGLYASTDGYPDDVAREHCLTFDALRALGDVTEFVADEPGGQP